MPCERHTHRPWPTSGRQQLVIEPCETICGWCNEYTTKSANNLRVHARRHIRNPNELLDIVIIKGKAGRKRLNRENRDTQQTSDHPISIPSPSHNLILSANPTTHVCTQCEIFKAELEKCVNRIHELEVKLHQIDSLDSILMISNSEPERQRSTSALPTTENNEQSLHQAPSNNDHSIQYKWEPSKVEIKLDLSRISSEFPVIHLTVDNNRSKHANENNQNSGAYKTEISSNTNAKLQKSLYDPNINFPNLDLAVPEFTALQNDATSSIFPWFDYDTQLHQEQQNTTISNPKNRDCSYYEKGTRTKADLRNHLEHEKLYLCQNFECSLIEGFLTQNDLNQHLKNKHPSLGSTEPPITRYRCLVSGCKRADKPWPRLDTFRNHLKLVHSLETNDQIEDMIQHGEFYEMHD